MKIGRMSLDGKDLGCPIHPRSHRGWVGYYKPINRHVLCNRAGLQSCRPIPELLRSKARGAAARLPRSASIPKYPECGHAALQFPMTRDEAIMLVSRALAAIQLITALLDITYLPAYLLSWHHHAQFGSSSIPSDYYTRLYTIELGALILRICGEFLLTLVLWNCGPWVVRFLLPPMQNEEKPAEGNHEPRA